MRARVVAVLIAMAAPVVAEAQEVRLQVERRGPYYVGTPIGVSVLARGFSSEPEPTSEVDPPEEGTLTFLGVSPSRSSSVVIVNGQMQQTSSVEFRYQYEYLASKPGTFELGPFRVRQLGTERSTVSYRLDVLDVPTTDRVEIELRLGSEKTYVGARVPVRLEYRVDRELNADVVRRFLQVPALGLRKDFRIEPGAPADQTVEISTPSGPLELPARTREETRDGRRWLVLSIDYSMIPLRAGRYAIDPSSMTIDVGVRFTLGLLGGRSATQVEKLRAVDRPRMLEVEPVPRQGRPPSFAGAVGRGFSLDVRADRSVVQVGDPIELTFTLRGDGPLEMASLPPLDAPGLLPDEDFSVPEGERTGQVSEEAKTFTTSVRVRREGVDAIPALAYSYFDPETGRFETVRTQPIALSVRPARIVGATEVVAPSEPRPDDESAATQAASPASQERGLPEELALGGLDLSIVRQPERLVRGGAAARRGAWLVAGVYAFAGLLVLVGWFDRRRRDQDPERAERRARIREQLHRIEQASRRDDLDGLRDVAQALRALRALCPEADSRDVERYLEECDEQLFSPDSAIDATRARALAERGPALARHLAGSAT